MLKLMKIYRNGGSNFSIIFFIFPQKQELSSQNFCKNDKNYHRLKRADETLITLAIGSSCCQLFCVCKIALKSVVKRRKHLNKKNLYFNFSPKFEK